MLDTTHISRTDSLESRPAVAAARSPRVLVVAPGIRSKGGVVSVVRAHRTLSLWQEMHCDLLSTFEEGGKLRKLITALSAYLRTPYRAWKADLVHIHLAGEHSLLRKLPVALIARALGRPVIAHVHASGPESLFGSTPAWALRLALGGADEVVALSESWARLLREHLPNAKITVIPNPVHEFTSSTDQASRSPAVLFVGKLETRKGYHVLLEAAEIVLRKHPETQFWFVGHGELSQAAEIAERLGIRKAVQLHGWLDSDRTAELFERARIFCLPSFNEGVPMAVLEAMSHGTPVVCTPVGGLSEFVVDEQTGLFSEVGDAHSTAQKIMQLLDHPAQASDMARRAMDRVQQQCGVSVVETALRQLYWKALTSKGQRHKN